MINSLFQPHLCRYFDVHTHRLPNTGDSGAVHSLYSNYALPESGWFSVGIHPWYLEETDAKWIALKSMAGDQRVVAIGECGLDARCNTTLAEQMPVFLEHIRLANALDKPLIIHCVAAFGELLGAFRKVKPLVPVVIHGYNKKQSVAELLLAEGMFLSFGRALLVSESPAARVLAAMPPDRFLLETDDSGLDIRDIYSAAATIRKTDIETIILQVRSNLKTVFQL